MGMRRVCLNAGYKLAPSQLQEAWATILYLAEKLKKFEQLFRLYNLGVCKEFAFDFLVQAILLSTSDKNVFMPHNDQVFWFALSL